MKIDKVTITGVDDNVAPIELKWLSQDFPFVEWGVLFSQSKQGTNRYPSPKTIPELLFHQLKLSAHFCGWHAREVLENMNYSLFEGLKNFHRVQLNYNFKKSSKWNLSSLIDWIAGHPSLSVIFQVNADNWLAIDYLDNTDNPENIHFLYDSSGGRGTVLKEIKPSYSNYTGYSGGIGPDNIEEVVQKITDYPNPINVWIDMESGVRTNDELDLKKVEKVLTICKKYISLPAFNS